MSKKWRSSSLLRLKIFKIGKKLEVNRKNFLKKKNLFSHFLKLKIEIKIKFI
jgi:hypothetical protein